MFCDVFIAGRAEYGVCSVMYLSAEEQNSGMFCYVFIGRRTEYGGCSVIYLSVEQNTGYVL